MRKKFFKKIFISVALILILGVISAGCGTPAPPPVVPPTPTTCTLTVYSQNIWCYGYVWVNGVSTGQWIDYNGAVTVAGLTVGTTASVQIVDNSGFYSHQELIVLGPGNNIVTFTYW